MTYLVESAGDEVRGRVRGTRRAGNAQAASWRLRGIRVPSGRHFELVVIGSAFHRLDRDLAVLAVLIPWDGCPLGVLVRRTLDRDRRAGLQSRVEKLGHRLPDLLARSRSVLAEVSAVPLTKKEPRAEGRRAGMNRAPDRLYHAVAVVLCVRVVCTLVRRARRP